MNQTPQSKHSQLCRSFVFYCLAFTLLVTFTSIAHAQDSLRSWTNTSGKVIKAEFVRLEGETLVIRKDGKVFNVPLSKLSAESQNQAKKFGLATAPDPVVVLPKTPSPNQVLPAATTSTLETPQGPKPESAQVLIESNPDLKKLIDGISSAQIRRNLIASIGLELNRKRPEVDIIAVGKIEIPEGARTLQDGTPQGGVLILQEGERKLSFAAAGGFTTNGTVYWGAESIPTSHWPWCVTSLQSGKNKTLKCLTLQHKEAVIHASNEKRHHGIALPTAKLDQLAKKDAFSVSSNVTCKGRPFPAHASLGLPGFTNPALRLRIDFDDGELKVDIPKAALETINPVTLLIENEYCYPSYVKVAPTDPSEDEFTSDPIELKLRQVKVLNVLVTNSGTFPSVNPRRFEVDTAVYNPPRKQHFSVVNSRGNDATASQSKEGVSFSIDSMVKYADLGKKLPRRALSAPVSSWLGKAKFQAAGQVLLKPEHYYLIEFEKPQQNDAPKWGIARIEPTVTKIDHRMTGYGKPGPNLRETLIRLGRFQTFFGFYGASLGNLNVNSPINDTDAKLIATLKRKVSVHLDNNHQLSPNGIRKIATSNNVEAIRFRSINMSKNLFRQLQLVNASKLQFDYCNVFPGKNLISSRRLSNVTFNNCDVDPHIVTALSGCVNLKTVTFKNCTGLSGNEQVFAQLPASVTSINLRNCKVDPRLAAALKNQRGQRSPRVVITEN